MLAPWKKSYDQHRQYIKKQRHYFANKGSSSQSYGFSSGHVRMWELDYKESWVPKNWWFWIVVLEKILESPLHCKEIKLVHPKGNQSWIFIGRTDAKAEAPILWPHDAKKTPWKRAWYWERLKAEGKGMTENEMVGWHYWLDGHEFEQVPGVGDGQGSLACCSPWGCKELDTTERLNWPELRELLRRARPSVGAWRQETGFSEYSWGTLRLLLDMGTVQRKGRCLDDAWVSNETKGNFET